ncbi:Cytochrome P450 monooxygenase apf7 [Lachnellula suecica]|uniref:Cytochrome P450 monooxygenase apf7 n=1 Tax=Lachnellula suecica TaxID=602035 RepID=A0A8T9BX87_9HELO|nr:Cytochrome P450 monooxygenase apf7 [Lachnellula suecica]
MIHARKRRVLNSAFSEKAVRSAADFITTHVDRWNELLIDGNYGKEWTTPQNMADLTDYLIFDIMGDLCFGKSFDLKEPGENPFRHMPHTIAGYMQSVYPITQSPMLRFWVWLKPRGLDDLFERRAPQKIKEFYRFTESSVHRRRIEEEASRASGAGENGGRKDLFHHLFRATHGEENTGYSTGELLAEASLLVVAGSDTTSTTMAGLWFYLTRYPRVYDKLVDEILSTFRSADEIQIGTKLSSCKYLRACIDETLRTVPAGVCEMAREVLPGGLDIAGDHIPEGTSVGVGTWSITHNQEVYGDPWIFRPERWLVDSATGVTAEDVARAQDAFNPFSIGQWNCVGQKMAMGELLITAAKTIYRMDVRLVPGDTLGGGSPELGWGLRDKNTIVLKDAYISIRSEAF